MLTELLILKYIDIQVSLLKFHDISLNPQYMVHVSNLKDAHIIANHQLTGSSLQENPPPHLAPCLPWQSGIKHNVKCNSPEQVSF